MLDSSRSYGPPLVLLAICLFGQPAEAEFAGGTGEPNDPYQIATAEQMNEIGANPGDWDRHFKLIADIDLSAYRGDEFNIIGNPPLCFCGTFDGGGHRILNFTYRSADKDNIGLFGWVWDMRGSAAIKNLCLVDANVDAGSGSYVGALIGSFWGGTVTGCCVRGGTISGEKAVGGLIGGVIVESPQSSPICWIPQGEVSQCCTSCTVRGKAYVGGLLGSNIYQVSNCYSTTDVTGDVWVGGLVGENLGTISNCYAAGHLWASVEAGGLVGIGYPAGVRNSFWDLDVSGWQLSAGGMPKTTAEMQMADTYLSVGWDFVGETENGISDIWKLCEGLDYPHLAWEKYGGGSGTIRDPYRICTAGQFRAVGEDPNDWDKHFKLIADIDLARLGRSVEVIGNEEVPFTGTFDGNAKAISGFSCTLVYGDRIGLFGYVKGNAWIKNLGLIAPNVVAEAGNYVGSLVGYLQLGTISDCYAEDGGISGIGDVGGLVGWNWGYILNCYSTCTVSGDENVGGLAGANYRAITNSSSTGNVSGKDNVGGLVGFNDRHQTITNCCSTGEVSGTRRVGGLLGHNRGTITNCYATGCVSAEREVGGLVGANYYDGTIWNCYSVAGVTGGQIVGGLVASGGGTFYNSFWDIQTSGQATSGGGTGKTTAEMQMASTFVGWGCDPVWTLDEGTDYPRLWWEYMPGEMITTPSFGSMAGSGTKHDPYLIHTAAELNMIGLFPCEWSKHFKLMADIDLGAFTGTAFNIIGNRTIQFTGIFDGNGRTIFNFSYTSKSRHFTGLFGYVKGGLIKDLTLIEPNIDVGWGTHVGSLVGWHVGGTISGCCAKGGAVFGWNFTGGLVGYNYSGTVTECCATCSASGNTDVGGLIGFTFRGTIANCYATGDVSSGRYNAGGLVGSNVYGTITNCYASGNVSAKYYNVGGLVGDNAGTIRNCYSVGGAAGTTSVGGLVGHNDSRPVADSFWDIQASGRGTSAAGTGRLTPYMQRALTFIIAGWDFVWEDIIGTDDIWCICEGQDYPKLTWQFVVGDFDGDGDVDFGDYGLLASRWHKTDGSFWCGGGGTDFTYDGYVDSSDLAEFAENWLGEGH